MKKFLLFLVISALVGMNWAAPIDPAMQQRVAQNFYKVHVGSSSVTAHLAFTGQKQVRGHATDCFNVYNIENGFVIVSADDRVKPILGYSTEGNFNAADLPFGLQDLLNGYVEEIGAIMENVPEASDELVGEWAALSNGSYALNRTTNAVDALMGGNNWNQNNGYNALCPADANGPGGHCYAGCCALSMGQVIRFWQHPTKGTGSHSYECNHSSSLGGLYGDYGTLSANFGNTTYNYASMPNVVGTSITMAIPTLLYHCGVALEMWYGNQGSMAFHDDIAEALETYFKYDECLTVWKNNYNGDWETLLKSDLDLGRPIIYCAYATEGGHEFVCDGYNTEDYFHFNMGWGGIYNGYYAVDNLNAQYNFNSSHGAVMHIRPLETNSVTENAAWNVTVYPNPAVSEIVVDCGESAATIRVYDMVGNLVIEKETISGLRTIDVGGLAPGTYFVRLTREGKTITKKVVKL